MKQLLFETSVSFNERWPRDGIMFVPTFLLFKDDTLTFEWHPTVEGRKLNIQIEETDEKGATSLNGVQIAAIQLVRSHEIIIAKKGLYNIPIENPSAIEDAIGTLKIFRIAGSSENAAQSCIPERYYQYSLTNQGKAWVKKAIAWGYRTDIGADSVKEFYGDTSTLECIFDSRKMPCPRLDSNFFKALRYFNELGKKN